MIFYIETKDEQNDPWPEEANTETEFGYGRGQFIRGAEPEWVLLLPKVKDRDSAEAYGKSLINWFNSNLRPGETKREFIRAIMPGDADYQKAASES